MNALAASEHRASVARVFTGARVMCAADNSQRAVRERARAEQPVDSAAQVCMRATHARKHTHTQKDAQLARRVGSLQTMSPQALALAAAHDESSAVQLVNESAAAYTNARAHKRTHAPPTARIASPRAARRYIWLSRRAI